MKQHVTFRLSAQDKATIKAVAKDNGMKPATMTRELVLFGLKKYTFEASAKR